MPAGLLLQSHFNTAFLPLEFFDDSEYDSRLPEEWPSLSLDEDGEKQDVLAKTLRLDSSGSTLSWQKCVVTSYDSQTERYTVSFDDGQTTEAPRIHLQFLIEDPEVFADRIVAAVQLRQQTELDLQYNLVVDCMPASNSDNSELLSSLRNKMPESAR